MRREWEIRYTWGEGIHCDVKAKDDKREDAHDYGNRRGHYDERCGSDAKLFLVNSILLDRYAGRKLTVC